MFVKELQDELAKATNNQQILEKALGQKDRHVAILLKEKGRVESNLEKNKDDILTENLKFNYLTGKVVSDEENILSESNVKLRNELTYWRKKVSSYEDTIQ